MISFEENERRFVESTKEEYLGNNKPINLISPKVSVYVTTYQHARFINKCLDQILAQKTSFSFEIVIGEDSSTDGTREICISYAEAHPDKIRLYLRDRKLTSMFSDDGKFYKSLNGVFTSRSCRGEYIAMCEGDDYWTDPLKLQKQVDFLEANPEYVMVFGNTALEIDGKLKPPTKDDFSFQRSDLLKSNILGTKTCVSLFKNVLHKSDFFMFNKVVFGDWLLWIMLLKYGKGYVMKDVLGVYRIHGGGIWSSLSEEEKFVGLLNFYDFISANLEELRETAKQAKLSFIKTSLQHQQVENRKIFDYLLLKHKVKMKLISIISKPHE
jgi:glycosyltransferase involved in cell wall biosynthesis